MNMLVFRRLVSVSATTTSSRRVAAVAAAAPLRRSSPATVAARCAARHFCVMQQHQQQQLRHSWMTKPQPSIASATHAHTHVPCPTTARARAAVHTSSISGWRQTCGFSSSSASSSSSSADEMHSDFQPKVNTEALDANAAKELIEKDITSSPVFVFMKGHPQAPQCGFSNQVCRILDYFGVEYGSRNVLADEAVRQGIKEFSDWPTIPQVYVNGEFVGGCDILTNMFKEGELKPFLEENNIDFTEPEPEPQE